MIAALIGVSTGVQQIDAAIGISNIFELREARTHHPQLVVGDKPICVSGFPEVSEESDELEFKIFHGRVRAYGYKFVELFILAYDSNQAQGLLTSFHAIVDNQVKRERPENSGAGKYLFDDDITPEDVIEIANKSEVIYTLFMGV